MKKTVLVFLGILCLAFLAYSTEKECEDIRGCGGDNWCAEASYIDGCRIGCPAHPDDVIQCASITIFEEVE